MQKTAFLLSPSTCILGSEALLIPLERIQKKGMTIHYDTGIQTYTAGWKGLTMMY
jgi:hypothetical protein